MREETVVGIEMYEGDLTEECYKNKKKEKENKKVFQI